MEILTGINFGVKLTVNATSAPSEVEADSLREESPLH